MNNNRSRLVFIDFQNLNHTLLKNRPMGGSEFQFYNLIKHLKDLFEMNICCYNSTSSFQQIDTITYDSLSSLYIEEGDIVIIQRFFPIHENFYSKIKYSKRILWIHDIPTISTFLGLGKKNLELGEYYEKNPEVFKNEILLPFFLLDNRVFLIANSNHTKEMLISFIQRYTTTSDKTNETKFFSRIFVIHNALYEEEFDNVSIVPKIPKRLIYASAWTKGIDNVLKVFDYIRSKDSDYTLSLFSPTYSWNHSEELAEKLKITHKDSVIVHGPVPKLELCKHMKESVCCLSSPFNETFGGVFAECRFVGTPVLADKTSGAVKEIIGEENIVDYENPESVWKKLQCVGTFTRVSLDPKFMANSILQKWKTILDNI